MAAAIALAAVVASPTALTAAPEDPGGTFFDDDGSAHEASIEAVAAEGITLGCDAAGTVYCPTAALSRAQMATFLARALDLPTTTTDFFTDDDNNTHETNINKVANAGITLGCTNDGNSYCPDDALNRAQMATFLARALDLPTTTTDFFTDDDNNTHETNINKVANAGITLGCTNDGNSYCPDDALNRAQMATFLARGVGLDPLDPATRPGTTSGFQLSIFELSNDCDDPLDCSGALTVPAGIEFFALEGWNLDNWSISSDLDREVFEDPGTRTEFVFNGGDTLRTVESFDVDEDDTARKRFSFQFPDSLTGTHQLEARWYQSGILSYNVTVDITIEG